MKKIHRLPALQKRLLLSILTAMVLTGCGGEKTGGTDTAAEGAETEAAEKEAVQEETVGKEDKSPEDSTRTAAGNNTQADKESAEDTAQSDAEPGGKTGIAGETAEDTVVDIKALQEENPDIFAWLHIPGTDIDCPVLQSAQADDYYESHNAYGESDEEGALYTELANLTG